MMKRIAVWLIETLSEILLCGIVLVVLLGHDPSTYLETLLAYSSGVALLLFTTGYLFTTLLVRAIRNGQTLWIYPAIATGLYFIHFEIMNVLSHGAFAPSDRPIIRAACACVVLVCTFVGSWLLRR